MTTIPNPNPRPWLGDSFHFVTDSAAAAAYLRQIADAIEGVGPIARTAVIVAFQATQMGNTSAEREDSVNRLAEALGFEPLTKQYDDGGNWVRTYPWDATAVTAYGVVDEPQPDAPVEETTPVSELDDMKMPDFEPSQPLPEHQAAAEVSA